MKRKTALSLLLCVGLLIGLVVPLTSCGKIEPREGTYTRMTVDINPSVEFMVDDRNKVVSATALNDDGSILIAGEAFVGKTPEEATRLVVKLASDTGYLVKGEIHAENTEEEQTVTVTISGDTKYAENLRKNVKKDVEKFLRDNHITAAVKNAKAATVEELRKIAVADGIFTEEEVAAMNEEQLNCALAAGRIETAQLLTAEMREAYFRAKEYRVSFAERQATIEIIDAMDRSYAATLALYRTALAAYSSAIEQFDSLRYDLFVSPESTYQKELARLRDAKEELLKEKKLMLSVGAEDETYLEISASYQLSEQHYNNALAAVERAGEQANAAMERVVSLMREGENQLRALEASFPTEIKTALTEKAAETENKINKVKDDFFAEFEREHADDIRATNDALQAKKEEMIRRASGE